MKRKLALVGGVAFAAAAVWAIFSFLGAKESRDVASALLAEGEQFLAEASGDPKGSRDLFVKALRRGEEALGRTKENPRAWILLARAYSGMGERTRAIEFFDRYLEKVPDDADALRDAGAAYRERWLLSKDPNHKVQAESYLQRALTLRPEDQESVKQLDLLRR